MWRKQCNSEHSISTLDGVCMCVCEWMVKGKYEHLFDISIIINLCAIFLQITFFFILSHSLLLLVVWYAVCGAVRCIYELWLMELTLTRICLREWKYSMQWFLPQKLNNKPSKWNGNNKKKKKRTDSTMAMKMTRTTTTMTTTIVECWMNVCNQGGFIFIFISRTSTTDYKTPSRCMLRRYMHWLCVYVYIFG